MQCRDIIALKVHDALDDILCEIISIIWDKSLRLIALCDFCRNLDLYKSCGCCVYSCPVLVYDLFTLLEECLLDVLLDKLDSLCLRKNVSDLEECSLHDCIDP